MSRDRLPLLLCILDGFGLAPASPHNAIHRARTPTWDALWAGHPHARLSASGEDVGLPAGQFGNSEVGHLNLGAGRIVYQDILRITRALGDGSFFGNQVLRAACRHARERGSALHLLGLVSDGGVHSHLDHLGGLLELARREAVERVYVHAFLDGRDTPPRSALGFAARLQEWLDADPRARVATVSGRYYAMDRDRRYERTRLALAALVEGAGERATRVADAVERAYARGEDDEFVRPTVLHDGGGPVARIADGDACICFNFRPDRVRQLTRGLALEDYPADRPRRPSGLHYVCFTRYDAEFPLPVAFPPELIYDTLGDLFAARGLRQLRLAETEKYAHVTYFFSGGREEPMAGEERILVPSPKVATYDLAPAMSARPVTEALEEAWRGAPPDLTVLNYANADMVGHTGVLPAAVQAIEVLDECLARLAAAVARQGGLLAVTADHGNAEKMWDEATGSPHTAHTSHPVPLVLVGEAARGRALADGRLADVAPTLLALLGWPRPAAMTGECLLA
jgi:2,3-bisphosphoglycerate-independent phosphoglycerate mutase